MALRAVPDHPKFAELKAILGQPKGPVAGWLEMVWHFAGRFTPQGNIGKYSDVAIEAWVEWTGEPGALIDALVKSKWIDRDSAHRLLVHDWPEHADKATKNALLRAKLPFCTPGVRTEMHDVRTTGSETASPSRLPVPVPVPESLPEPVPVPEPGRSVADTVDVRIVCETVGIFGMREQADMTRLLAVYLKESGNTVENAMNHMAARWEQYLAGSTERSWSYGSSYRFFMSGGWNKPETWARGPTSGKGRRTDAEWKEFFEAAEAQ